MEDASIDSICVQSRVATTALDVDLGELDWTFLDACTIETLVLQMENFRHQTPTNNTRTPCDFIRLRHWEKLLLRRGGGIVLSGHCAWD